MAADGILSSAAVVKMTTPEQPPSAPLLRGFGWDIDSPFSSNRGDLLPVGSFGHTGFTGTSMWIDPTTQTYIILLTNAVHPRGKGNAIGLRSKVATEVAAALNLTTSEKEAARLRSITGYNEAWSAARRMSARNGAVKTGIDVLEEHGFDVLKAAEGKKHIGLVTNQTGLDASGKRTIDVLANAPGVSLDAIFSPEHGVTGTLDTTDINNSKDCCDRHSCVQRVWRDRRCAPSGGRGDAAPSTRLCSTFRMPVFVSTLTKLRWDIFLKRRRNLASR